MFHLDTFAKDSQPVEQNEVGRGPVPQKMGGNDTFLAMQKGALGGLECSGESCAMQKFRPRYRVFLLGTTPGRYKTGSRGTNFEYISFVTLCAQPLTAQFQN